MDCLSESRVGGAGGRLRVVRYTGMPEDTVGVSINQLNARQDRSFKKSIIFDLVETTCMFVSFGFLPVEM